MEKRHIKAKTQDFQLPNKIRQLITYIDIYLDNFPHKHIQIKDRIANTSYDMLYCTYKANKTDNVYVKLDLIDELYANVQVLEFLIHLSYEKKIINSKRVNKFGHTLGTISSMLTGWKKETLREKQKYENKYNLYVPNKSINMFEQNKINVFRANSETSNNKIEKQDANKEKKTKVKQELKKNLELEQKFQNMDLDCPKPIF